jgi:hypothetical protein
VMSVVVGPLLVTQLNPPSDPGSQKLMQSYYGATYPLLAVVLGMGLLLAARLIGKLPAATEPAPVLAREATTP